MAFLPKGRDVVEGSGPHVDTHVARLLLLSFL